MSAQHQPSLSHGFLLGCGVVVTLWLALIVALGFQGVFHRPVGEPPWPTLLAMLLPPLVFLLLLRRPSFALQVLAIDPVWLAAVHGLRILGASFLVAYAFGLLPGVFAFPAGWGDILVALLAPFAAVMLARHPDFLRSKWLWRFHALGMLDFLGAIGSGLLARLLIGADYALAPTTALSQFPLLLIPCFAVPLWICLHIAAFHQIANARRGGRVLARPSGVFSRTASDAR